MLASGGEDVPDGRPLLGEGESVVVRDSAEVHLRRLWHRADADIEMVDPRAGALFVGGRDAAVATLRGVVTAAASR